jgi:hypothetical protein
MNKSIIIKITANAVSGGKVCEKRYCTRKKEKVNEKGKRGKTNVKLKLKC